MSSSTQSSARRRMSKRSALFVVAITGLVLAMFVGSSYGDEDNDPSTFDPTVTFETSTTRATAHPDARITIDNSGNTADIGSISISLPDGFWGSLASINSKCQNFTTGSGSSGSDDCVAADSKIGTVKATATIDQSEATLTGDVYIVESDNPDVAARLGIKVHAKVGGVDMGYVRVTGSAAIRGNAIGMDTVFENLPNSITQVSGPNSRTVDFHLERMTVDLKSDLDGPNAPLLTNPSKCGSSDFIATLGTGPSLGGIDDVTISQPYAVDQCDTVKFSASEFNFTATDPVAAQETGFTTQIDIEEGSASLSALTVKLPAAIGLHYNSFGVSADRCGLLPDPDEQVFDPSLCPPNGQSKIGEVTLVTPLLDDPVTGDVHLVDKSPNPWIGIDVNPNIAGNPAGVTLRLMGTTAVPQRDTTCNSTVNNGSNPCQGNVLVNFSNIPDAPVTSVSLVANGPSRNGDMASLSGETLAITNGSSCQPFDEVLADFTSHSTVDDIQTSTYRKSAQVSTVGLTGCSADPIGISGSVVGAETTDTTPTFDIAPGASPGPNFFCGIDAFNGSSPGTACSTTYTRGTAVLAGAHRVYAATTSSTISSNNHTTRGFAVVASPPTLAVAPDTNFDGTPPAVTGTTPSFDFTADQDSTFQCSLDGGAFLPCGSGPPSQAGSYTVTSDNAFLPGSEHTFAVRAQNAEGTVDLSPASVTFDVSVAFSPTFDVLSTTNQARAHPDLDIEISNDSEEKVKDTTIKLPDGFFGGLQGVQAICPVATAAAGNCTAASKVGTVDTEATVDDSETIVRISGDVYLTEKLQAGDAAGLSIKVDAQIQEIDLGSIIVPGRLMIRGQAQGIDSLVVDIPESIVPNNPFGDTETFFNIRKITLKLRTGAGAAQPLLTNPSSCSTSDFSAEFTGNGDPSPSTTGPELIPYTTTGCELLGFSPALSASVVRSADGKPIDSTEYQPINLSATLSASPDQAGIKQASVLLPKPITIDVSKLPLVLCEQAQYETNTCPAGTLIGNASATSPLLPAGEILQGNIYLLRAVPPRVIPRLFIRLEGRIGISLVAQNSFENGTQIRAEFTDLPDAPLNSFSMNVNNFLLSQKAPCQDAEKFGSAMTGTLTGFNGKTQAVNSNFAFNCAGIFLKHRYKKGKNPTLTMGIEARSGMPAIKSARLQFGKYLTLNKKRLKKALIVRANGKKLAAKCFRLKSKSILDLSLCKKRYTRIDLTFKRGALIGAKKLRRPTVKLTLVDAANKRYVRTVKLSSPAPTAQLWSAAK